MPQVTTIENKNKNDNLEFLKQAFLRLKDAIDLPNHSL